MSRIGDFYDDIYSKMNEQDKKTVDNANIIYLKFNINGEKVTAYGIPDLEELTGFLSNDGMAFFFGRNVYLANTATGKARQFTSGSTVLANNNEIDFEAIKRECPHGKYNAESKTIRYAGLSHWNGFKDGLCAISWMLYPDGQYFADSDGYGMQSNDEETVYAIIDTDLNIIEPFRPIKDVSKHLNELRARRRAEAEEKER